MAGRRAGKAGETAEVHLNDPMAIAQLQAAARDNSVAAYRQYAALTHKLNQQINLRGMFRFKRAAQPLSLDEVRLDYVPVPAKWSHATRHINLLFRVL